MQVTYDFSGKSVLLIGGTTGIGRATAIAFAKAGANLFVAGVGAEHGASLAAEIKALKKGAVEFAEVDVRDAKAMADAARPRRSTASAVSTSPSTTPACSGKTAPVQELDEADFDLLDGRQSEGHLPWPQASGART